MSFRILSLDGGGTWALIQVKALISIYGPTATGHTVLNDFDLVAANSGGSIVAAGLACNFPLQQILADFLDPNWRGQIFVPLPWYSKLNPISLVVPQPKYDAQAKLVGLQKAFKTANTDFGGTQLAQLPVYPLALVLQLVPSINYVSMMMSDSCSMRVLILRISSSERVSATDPRDFLNSSNGIIGWQMYHQDLSLSKFSLVHLVNLTVCLKLYSLNYLRPPSYGIWIRRCRL